VGENAIAERNRSDVESLLSLMESNRTVISDNFDANLKMVCVLYVLLWKSKNNIMSSNFRC
jgi:hypothetical protein